MNEAAEESASPLTEERARAILRSMPDGGWLADNLDKRCSCNACNACAATFLVKLQDRLTGPTVFITGWRIGMNKIGVGKLLNQSGIGLGEAFRLTNQILEQFRRGSDPNKDWFDDGPPVQIQVAAGIDRDNFIAKLRDLGILIE